MRQAISVSLAPVIFSHSSARGVADHARNVPDDVITLLKTNRGIIMINFYSCFLVNDCAQYNATADDVVKHINHVRRLIGVDHIGIGADYNGVDQPAIDLPDVSYYPKVFEALIEDGEFEWTDEDLGKLANGNLIRVLKEVEQVRDALQMKGAQPDNSMIDEQDNTEKRQCMSEF